MGKYASLRALPFTALAKALGIDMNRFKRRKDDWQGYCPIHGSKNNNGCFGYHDNGKWHCLSCGAHGSGMIDLVKTMRSCGFQQAVDFLTVIEPLPASNAPQNANSERTEAASKPFDLTKYQKHTQPCEWLEKRIPDAAVRERYGVFFYSNPSRKSAFTNRVLIPIRDLDGNLKAYLGRAIEPETQPKYLVPRDFPKSAHLFGAHELKSSPLPLKVVFVGESPWMVMRFAMMNLPAVALYGWCPSDDQIDILATLAKGVYYLPDRNKYQESAGVVQRLARRLWVRAPELPLGVDDAEYLSIQQVQAL